MPVPVVSMSVSVPTLPSSVSALVKFVVETVRVSLPLPRSTLSVPELRVI